MPRQQRERGVGPWPTWLHLHTTTIMTNSQYRLPGLGWGCVHLNEATPGTSVVIGQVLQERLLLPGRVHTLTTKLPKCSPKLVPVSTQLCLLRLTNPLLQVSYPQQVVIYLRVSPGTAASPQNDPNMFAGVEHRLIRWVSKGQLVWAVHKWRGSSRLLTAHALRHLSSTTELLNPKCRRWRGDTRLQLGALAG